MLRSPRPWCILLLLLAGCARSPLPTDPPLHPTAAPLPAGGSWLGQWSLHLAPDFASATLDSSRSAQQTDDVYLLSLDNFLRPDSLRIRQVRRTADAIEVQLRFAHPFAAPADLDAPATATNRADLGIIPRLVLLSDLPTSFATADYTFFSGEAILYPGLLANADGYFQPGGTLPQLAGQRANTYPYRMLVDEAAGTGGNRVGLSNGGSGTGNYNAAAGGWQRSNIGPDRHGWTGYGMLQQGQAADLTLAFDLARVIADGRLDLDLAVWADYIDPRGGTTALQKRANRLPANPADVFAFVYRMPHGAPDVPVLRLLRQDGAPQANTPGTSSTLHLHVTDWDARSTASTFSDLADDPDPSRVPAGTPGIPALAVHAPGITSAPQSLVLADDDSEFGGDPGADTGVARDPLYFTGAVTNNVPVSQTAGDFWAVVRAVDPADALDRSGWEFPLDPQLGLLSSAPPRRTWLPFRVTLEEPGECTLKTLAFTFDAGPDGWTPGGTNSDWHDWGHFRQGCGSALSETNAGGWLSAAGTYLSTGDDNDNVSCDFVDDYGPGAVYTIQSPIIQVPALCGPTYRLLFNAYVYGDSSSTASALVSYDHGLTWEPLWTQGGTGNEIIQGDVTVGLDATQAPGPVRIAFAFASGPAEFETPNGELAGLAVDNIRIEADAVSPLLVAGPNSTGLCDPRTLAFDFTHAGGWQGGQFFGLPNGDAQAVIRPQLGGLGSFRWTSCSTLTDSTGTYAAVQTASGGVISGPSLNIGADQDQVDGGLGTFCQLLDDFGSPANYNIVSPRIWLPALCSGGQITARWDAYLNTDAESGTGAAAVRVYVSTDNGATWSAPVWTANATAGGTTFANATASLTAYAGQGIRLRFQFESTAGSVQRRAVAGQAFGFFVDNVAILHAGGLQPLTAY